MARSTKEWIGKTDDSRVPKTVKLRVFERYHGICHISGIKISASDNWECDHIVALINGGENRESNLAPALPSFHRRKTKADVAIKAKDQRVRKKHVGITDKTSFPTNRKGGWKKKMDGTVVKR